MDTAHSKTFSEGQITTASKTRPALLYTIFFVSGVAALIYEISWGRQLGLLLGHTIHAAAVVLTAYFAGLSVGYAVGARIAHRVNPLKAYGVAEIVAAIWACLIPTILAIAESPSIAATLRSDVAAWQLAIRAVFSLAILLPATVALGATLPFMTEALARGTPQPQSLVSRAYALNTAGAFVGVVVSTGVLLVVVGVTASGFVAAGLSGFCGLAAILLSRQGRRVTAAREADAGDSQIDDSLPPCSEFAEPKSNSPDGSAKGLWILLAGLCGFGTLSLEVLYVRLFSLVFHNSTYTFGIVVTVFLVGLSLGAWFVGLLTRWFHPKSILAACCWAGAIAVPLSALLFVRVTQLEYVAHGDGFLSYMSSTFGLVATIVLLPATTLGMALPALWSTACSDDTELTRIVGRTTMANTLAAAFGSIATSFVLLPSLGLWDSFGFVAIIFSLVAGSVLLRQQRPLVAMFAGLTVLAAIVLLSETLGPELRVKRNSDEQLIQRWNSAYGWVDVVFDETDGSMKLRQNLHYRFGATGPSAQRIYRQGHLPLLLHPQPRNVAFLGLGTGLTAASSVLHPELQTIAIVELVPEVVEASRLLGEHNFGVVDHARTRLTTDDARHFLQGTDQQFDVIVSDLFVPWESETGYLYTVEHYQQAKNRLRSSGLFCQWLPLYQLGENEFEMIADSFASVFPHTTLWWGNLNAEQGVIALIGSDHSLKINASETNSRLSALRATNLFNDEMIASADRLYAQLAGGWTERHPERLNTDEHPRVEFLSPISYGNRRLLQNQVLEQYYDSVLATLPEGDVNYLPGSFEPVPTDKERRRFWQRLILFGDEPDEPRPELAFSRESPH